LLGILDECNEIVKWFLNGGVEMNEMKKIGVEIGLWIEVDIKLVIWIGAARSLRVHTGSAPPPLPPPRPAFNGTPRPAFPALLAYGRRGYVTRDTPNLVFAL